MFSVKQSPLPGFIFRIKKYALPCSHSRSGILLFLASSSGSNSPLFLASTSRSKSPLLLASSSGSSSHLLLVSSKGSSTSLTLALNFRCRYQNFLGCLILFGLLRPEIKALKFIKTYEWVTFYEFLRLIFPEYWNIQWHGCKTLKYGISDISTPLYEVVIGIYNTIPPNLSLLLTIYYLNN